MLQRHLHDLKPLSQELASVGVFFSQSHLSELCQYLFDLDLSVCDLDLIHPPVSDQSSLKVASSKQLSLELIEVGGEVGLNLLSLLLLLLGLVFGGHLVKCFASHQVLDLHFERQVEDLSLFLIQLLLLSEFLGDLSSDEVVKGMHSHSH